MAKRRKTKINPTSGSFFKGDLPKIFDEDLIGLSEEYSTSSNVFSIADIGLRGVKDRLLIDILQSKFDKFIFITADEKFPKPLLGNYLLVIVTGNIRKEDHLERIGMLLKTKKYKKIDDHLGCALRLTGHEVTCEKLGVFHKKSKLPLVKKKGDDSKK